MHVCVQKYGTIVFFTGLVRDWRDGYETCSLKPKGGILCRCKYEENDWLGYWRTVSIFSTSRDRLKCRKVGVARTHSFTPVSLSLSNGQLKGEYSNGGGGNLFRYY